MAISTAIQKRDWVYVYNEKNNITFYTRGELMGYTSTTVSIKLDHVITVCGEKGNIIDRKFV